MHIVHNMGNLFCVAMDFEVYEWQELHQSVYIYFQNLTHMYIYIYRNLIPLELFDLIN